MWTIRLTRHYPPSPPPFHHSTALHPQGAATSATPAAVPAAKPKPNYVGWAVAAAVAAGLFWGLHNTVVGQQLLAAVAGVVDMVKEKVRGKGKERGVYASFQGWGACGCWPRWRVCLT